MSTDAAEQWQRLSPWALVFIVVNGLITTVRQNIGFFLGAGAGFVFLDWLGPRELALGAAALLLFAIVAAMIYHRRFRFRLEGDAIRILSGIIERKELRIRFERVLNVNLSQPFYLRPLGLVRFSLETAGAAQKEVELPGIARELAEELRERIAAARARSELAETGWSTEPVTGGSLLYRARGGDLLLHGLASNQIWVMAGAFLGLVGLFQQRLSDWGLLETLGERLLEWFGSPLAAAVAVAGGVFVAIAVLSMLISRVRYNGYRLQYSEDARDETRFLSRAGLLDRKEQTLPATKLHAFELVQTAIGRALNRWYLVGRQAGTLDVGEQPRRGQFLVPGLGGKSARPLLTQILERGGDDSGTPPPESELERVAPLFRRVMGLRLMLVIIPLSLALVVAPAEMGILEPVSRWLIAAALPLLALALVHRRWQRWGYAVRARRAWIRYGLFGQRIVTFSLERVQQIQVRQSPVQYRKYVANLVLVLPHGPVTVPFLPLEAARAMANEVLYRVETATEHRI